MVILLQQTDCPKNARVFEKSNKRINPYRPLISFVGSNYYRPSRHVI